MVTRGSAVAENCTLLIGRYILAVNKHQKLSDLEWPW